MAVEWQQRADFTCEHMSCIRTLSEPNRKHGHRLASHLTTLRQQSNVCD